MRGMLDFAQRVADATDKWWDRGVGLAQRRRLARVRQAIVGDRAAPFPWRRHLVTVVAIVAFVGLDAARRGLDDAVAKIHQAGANGYGVNSLHRGTKIASAALQAWRAGDLAFKDFKLYSASSIARAHTLVELVLVAFSGVLLYGIVRYVRNKLEARAEVMEEANVHRIVLLVAAATVPVYMALGFVNQVLELVLIERDKAIGIVPKALVWLSLTRRLALAAIVLPVLVTGVLLWRRTHTPLRVSGSAYRVLVTFGLAHFVLLQVSVPAEQNRDAMRLWPVHGWLALWGIGATALFALVLGLMAIRLGHIVPTVAEPGQGPGSSVLSKSATLWLTAAGLAVTAVGYGLHRYASWGNGVTALGMLVAGVGLLSLPIVWHSPAERARPAASAPPAGARLVVPGLLTIAPLVSLERAAVSAGMPEVIHRSQRQSFWLIGAAGVLAVLAVGGYLGAHWYGERVPVDADRGGRAGRLGRARLVAGGCLLGAGVLALACAIWVVVDPVRHARSIGVHGLLGSFLVLATLAISMLGMALDGGWHRHRQPLVPAAFDFLQLRRVPIVAGLLAWGVLGNVLPDGHYHQIRVLRDQAESKHLPVTASDAFDRWLGANAAGAKVVPGADVSAATRTVPGVPMVFVAAAGGGIRAATFTASTIECLFLHTDPSATERCAAAATSPTASADWRAVFAASGASGGSVGIASAVAERAGSAPHNGWVAERLGTDLLSPQLAWQLLVETPNTLLTFNPKRDRGAVLEETWEQRFGPSGPSGVGRADEPFLADFGTTGWNDPLLYFGGTNLVDGCRVNISAQRAGVARAAGAAPVGTTSDGDCRSRRDDGGGRTLDQTVVRDLRDYLCDDEDVRLSTAAFLSARFPIVSPSGIVPDLLDRRPECGRTTGSLSIGDGGYRDNTGAAALSDLWTQLKPLVAAYNRTHDRCVVPMLLEIDNGHRNLGAAASPPGSGLQLTAPLTGAMKVFASRDAGPIEELAAEFSRPLDASVSVSVASLGGGPDPAQLRYAQIALYEHPGVLAPLGWSLSPAAVDDLSGQLDRVEQNARAVDKVASWLQPASLTCTVRAGG